MLFKMLQKVFTWEETLKVDSEGWSRKSACYDDSLSKIANIDFPRSSAARGNFPCFLYNLLSPELKRSQKNYSPQEESSASFIKTSPQLSVIGIFVFFHLLFRLSDDACWVIRQKSLFCLIWQTQLIHLLGSLKAFAVGWTWNFCWGWTWDYSQFGLTAAESSTRLNVIELQLSCRLTTRNEGTFHKLMTFRIDEPLSAFEFFLNLLSWKVLDNPRELLEILRLWCSLRMTWRQAWNVCWRGKVRCVVADFLMFPE